MLALLAAGPALACSCVDEYDAAPARWQRMIAEAQREFPIVVDGRVIAVEPPLRCRITPLRWGLAMMGGQAQVRYRAVVERRLRGSAPAQVVIVQTVAVSLAGCRPAGSGACRPGFGNGVERWALKRVTGGYERATLCTEHRAIDGLPPPPALRRSNR